MSARECAARDLESVTMELREVREALRQGISFLGMSGTLLQEYFIELARKDNLLRQALARAAPDVALMTKARSASRTCGPRQPAVAEANSVASGRRGGSVCATSPATAAGVHGTEEGRKHRNSPSPSAQDVGAPVKPHVDTVSNANSNFARSAPGFASREGLSCPVSASCSSVRAAAVLHCADVSTLQRPALSPESQLEEVDCTNLVAVLQFLELHQKEAAAQRVGVHAIGRLARDQAQLRPLCIAAAAAVARTVRHFPEHLGLQRLAVAALGSLAYIREVSALIAQEALPALFTSMVGHPRDDKLQALACEALARLAQAGSSAVAKAIIQAMLGHEDANAVCVCCWALLRLNESEICRPSQIMDVLVPLTESQPGKFELQRRASDALRWLVKARVIEEVVAKKLAPNLLSVQWAHLLARFDNASQEEAKTSNEFHASVQAMFHEEVVKHFEYEASERCLHLCRRGVSGADCLLEVVKCLVENLEDYHVRLEARELVWDSALGKLVPLDDQLRRHLCEEASRQMEYGFIEALQAAAAGASAHAEQQLLSRRRSLLRSECAALLDRKTEATQQHQERTMELRREVMLFEAVEYLEMVSSGVSATQVRTALHMLETVEVEGLAPPDALERVRARLECLACGRLSPAVPG